MVSDALVDGPETLMTSLKGRSVKEFTRQISMSPLLSSMRRPFSRSLQFNNSLIFPAA